MLRVTSSRIFMGALSQAPYGLKCISTTYYANYSCVHILYYVALSDISSVYRG